MVALAVTAATEVLAVAAAQEAAAVVMLAEAATEGKQGTAVPTAQE